MPHRKSTRNVNVASCKNLHERSILKPAKKQRRQAHGIEPKERRAVTEVVAMRYQKAGKKEKGKILDEFVEVTGYNRGGRFARILGIL